MEQIVRSLTPTALLVAGAVVFVLGAAFLIASDATLSSSSFGAASDLAQAGRWLQFLAGAAVLAAACTAGWDLILRSEVAAGAEIAAVALGALLFMIGLLVSAASNGSAADGPVTGAVGIGVWAMVVLSRAARVSLAEQGAPAHAQGTRTDVSTGQHHRQADLWLAAAIGLFIAAIGYGLTSAGGRGPGIAAGAVEAAGVAVLFGSITAAQPRGLLRSRPVFAVLTGLVLLAISFLAAAIVSGLAFATPSATGAGFAVVTAITLAGVAALGLAAWTQVRALSGLPEGAGVAHRRRSRDRSANPNA